MRVSEYERQLPGFLLPSPESDSKRWLRFECPNCTGKSRKTAVVNYAADWVSCFRCKASGVMPDHECWAVREFYPQIRSQVFYLGLKFGRWFTEAEIWSKARELVWVYAEGELGQPNDAGKLSVWMESADNDRDRVERFLAQALKGDLLNWASNDVRKRRKATDGFEGALYYDPLIGTPVKDGNPDDPAIWENVWDLPCEDNLLDAENESIPFEAEGCTKTRNGLGPYKDCCASCALKCKPRTDDWVRKYRGHQESVSHAETLQKNFYDE